MRGKILKLLEEKGALLPPLPEVLFNLEKLINDPDNDIESIADLVETEPVLSGKLIKLANSAFFSGSREKAKDVPAVVLRLGLKMLLDLAYTLELPQMFDKLKGFDQINFWKHSMAVAFLARSFAHNLGLDKNVQKDIYMGGLIHDVGVLVFFFLIPEEYKEFSKVLKNSKKYQEDLEHEAFGIAHPELGARFLELHWPVSETVIKAARNHSDKGILKASKTEFDQIINFANTIVKTHDIVHQFTTRATLPPDKEFLDVLDLSLEELEALIEETRQKVDQAEKILKG